MRRAATGARWWPVAEMLVAYVPLDGFLYWLATGWQFSGLVVQPMQGHHGFWSCVMHKED